MSRSDVSSRACGNCRSEGCLRGNEVSFRRRDISLSQRFVCQSPCARRVRRCESGLRCSQSVDCICLCILSCSIKNNRSRNRLVRILQGSLRRSIIIRECSLNRSKGGAHCVSSSRCRCSCCSGGIAIRRLCGDVIAERGVGAIKRASNLGLNSGRGRSERHCECERRDRIHFHVGVSQSIITGRTYRFCHNA